MRKHTFERQSPGVTLLLSLLTFGLYIPIWFLVQRKAINALSETQKLDLTGPLVITIIYLFSNIVSLFVMLSLVSYENTAFVSNFDTIEKFVTLTGGIWTLVLVFRVKNILKEYTDRRNYEMGYSGFYAFFLGIYYLQYKINQLLREEENYVDIDAFGQGFSEEDY